MKFAFIDNERGSVWIVVAVDKHNAIAEAVEAGFSESMHDFYYGLEDGQITIYEVAKEIPEAS